MTELCRLPVGSTVRLYRRYPDGKRRPPLLWKPPGAEKYINLTDTDLRILSIERTHVLVETEAGVHVPLARSLRIKEAVAYDRKKRRARANRRAA